MVNNSNINISNADLDFRDSNQRIKQDQVKYETLRDAAMLLRDDNLVWSADMEAIRYHLGLALDAYSIRQQYDNRSLERVAEILMGVEIKDA